MRVRIKLIPKGKEQEFRKKMENIFKRSSVSLRKFQKLPAITFDIGDIGSLFDEFPREVQLRIKRAISKQVLIFGRLILYAVCLDFVYRKERLGSSPEWGPINLGLADAHNNILNYHTQQTVREFFRAIVSWTEENRN